MSLKSRKSWEGQQKRGDEKLQAGGAHQHDAVRTNLSRAAAWVWHMRGSFGEAAVLPTKRVIGHSSLAGRLSNNNWQRIREEARQEMMRRRRLPLPASRFKEEVSSAQLCSGELHPSADQASYVIPADHLPIEQRRPSPCCTFLYDDLELISLQELVDRTAAADHDDPHKPVKPFSAIHKIFKRLIAASRSMLYIPAHTPQSRNSSINSARPLLGSSEGSYPRNSAVHHVVHHHHHHYYNHLHDLPQHSYELAEVSHHQLVRRRRHSESSYDHPSHAAQHSIFNTTSSCDEARSPGLESADSTVNVVSSKAIANHCRPLRRFSAAAAADHDQRAHSEVPETPEILGAGRKLAFMDHSSRPRRHSYCVSAPAPALH